MTPNIDKIVEHYNRAREKHPYFCDRITCLSDVGADTHLELKRSLLGEEIRAGDVEAVTVIQCELFEAVQAYTHGDNTQAVEELYDCVAVVLRAIDVLEGRQELGKPEAMTNEQKYKTPEERRDAFFEFCNKNLCTECKFRDREYSAMGCPFNWLADEYKEPKQDLPFKIELFKTDEYQVYIALGVDWPIRRFKAEINAVSFCNKLNAAALAWHKRMMEKEGK